MRLNEYNVGDELTFIYNVDKVNTQIILTYERLTDFACLITTDKIDKKILLLSESNDEVSALKLFNVNDNEYLCEGRKLISYEINSVENIDVKLIIGGEDIKFTNIVKLNRGWRDDFYAISDKYIIDLGYTRDLSEFNNKEFKLILKVDTLYIENDAKSFEIIINKGIYIDLSFRLNVPIEYYNLASKIIDCNNWHDLECYNKIALAKSWFNCTLNQFVQKIQNSSSAAAKIDVVAEVLYIANESMTTNEHAFDQNSGTRGLYKSFGWDLKNLDLPDEFESYSPTYLIKNLETALKSKLDFKIESYQMENGNNYCDIDNNYLSNQFYKNGIEIKLDSMSANKFLNKYGIKTQYKVYSMLNREIEYEFNEKMKNEIKTKIPYISNLIDKFKDSRDPIKIYISSLKLGISKEILPNSLKEKVGRYNSWLELSIFDESTINEIINAA